jgi:hypothetical protein
MVLGEKRLVQGIDQFGIRSWGQEQKRSRKRPYNSLGK